MFKRGRSFTQMIFLCIFLLLLGSWEARADSYETSEAGRPWRIMAYLLHPVGVTLDYLIARPLHRILHLKPVDKLTGHSKFTEGERFLIKR